MKKTLILILSLILLTGCSQKQVENNGKLNVVTTTTMITDLVSTIGGDYINITGLMEAGVDPHLYKAKESDSRTLSQADIVVFNGVHLEAKLADILDSLSNTIKLENGLDASDIIDDGEGGEDPHIWFDVSLWKKSAIEVEKGLSLKDPDNASQYKENLDKYLIELDALQDYVTKRIEEVDSSQRVLVTAHDAFNYFGKSNGFEVKAIQGISTESEASTSSISQLADYIASNKIKAIFTESSISPKTIESVQQAVKSRGFEVSIGTELYSDSLKENASYIDTFKLNVDAIVDALK